MSASTQAAPPQARKAALKRCRSAGRGTFVGLGIFAQGRAGGQQTLLAYQKSRFFKGRLDALYLRGNRGADHQFFAVAEKIAVLPKAFHPQAGICVVARAAAHGPEGQFAHGHLNG